MSRRLPKSGTAVLLGLAAVLPLSCSGDDGAQGPPGPPGPAGGSAINASTASPETLESLEIQSEITGVTIDSPPVVTFTLSTSKGVPITGIVPFWEESSRYVRFTMTKLVPGTNGEPNTWVSYTRDATSGDPDYDTGSSLVDNGDGSYTFTFNTDVTAVTGVTYEPGLTHRVAGQIGSRSVPLQPQNLWLDFVPDGSAVTTTRRIATMASCNECHDNLVFHGRRFETEYCVQCHNPDLAQGEGNFSFMIHRIHRAGDFTTLGGGVSFAELTLPMVLNSCRKCHNGDDAVTPDANNWRDVPNMAACTGCHDSTTFGSGATHTGGPQSNNANCANCHNADAITGYHASGDPAPNNPEIPTNQHAITYEVASAAVDGTTGDVTVEFKILSDGTPLDILNLPAEFKDGTGAVFRYPGFLLAYALPQGGINEPADWNNDGRTSAQPISVSLGDLGPTTMPGPAGTVAFDSGTGVMTAVLTGSPFPMGATMRAVGLQGYLRQDLDNDGVYDASLHAPSALAGVTGDAQRRSVVDTAKCASCHDWFNGHGGNRVFAPGSDLICTMCHVPNLSSSGRTVNLAHPEDAQNFKDMIHGIHSSGFRDRAFEHVRIRGGNEYFYDWSHVTFPRGAETSNCALCHDGDSYQLPLDANALATTVRTTGTANGQDPTPGDVTTARSGGNLPNATDWVNSATASSCFYCHTSTSAYGHMIQNGAQLSVPVPATGPWTNRSALGTSFESCATCHGPGSIADLDVVHNR